jgi:hypothetical protein
MHTTVDGKASLSSGARALVDEHLRQAGITVPSHGVVIPTTTIVTPNDTTPLLTTITPIRSGGHEVIAITSIPTTTSTATTTAAAATATTDIGGAAVSTSKKKTSRRKSGGRLITHPSTIITSMTNESKQPMSQSSAAGAAAAGGIIFDDGRGPRKMQRAKTFGALTPNKRKSLAARNSSSGAGGGDGDVEGGMRRNRSFHGSTTRSRQPHRQYTMTSLMPGVAFTTLMPSPFVNMNTP